MVASRGGDPDERDVSKPISLDEQDRPLYAPRGLVWRRRYPGIEKAV